MKIFKFLFFVFLLIFCQQTILSQELMSDEIIVEGEEQFLIHTVIQGETIYSITKKYNVESRELIRHNPSLVQGLKTGTILKIPFNNNIEEITKPVVQEQEPSFIIHKIKRRETPYFVANKYGISIDDIYKYNPDLEKFKRGEKIKIPQFDEPLIVEQDREVIQPEEGTTTLTESSDFIEHRVKPDETLFSISKLYNRPINEIIHYNPEAQQLKIGMLIKLPKGGGDFLSVDEEMEGDFLIHMIETGETLYGISKKYKVSESELKELNPVLETGFPAGVKIKIPTGGLPEMTVNPVNDDAFIRHEVEKGETLYRLSAEYNLKVADIKKVNPVLQSRDNLRIGETILIPKNIEPEPVVVFENRIEEKHEIKNYFDVETIIEVPEGCRPNDHRGFFFETYHIGLMLPLFLEANDTLNIKPVVNDTLIAEEFIDLELVGDTIEHEFDEEDQAWHFYWRSEDFLNFYEGVLIAIDSMRNRGMNVELHVYDTGLNKNTVDSLITTDEFFQLDLIIGPVTSELQKTVAEYAFKNRIPMVSPLSQEGRFIQNNPYYLQIYPSQEFLMQKTADFIADKYYDSNFIVLEIGNPSEEEELFVEMCRERLYNTGYYQDINEVPFRLYNYDQLGPHGLSRILSKTRENVFIIPSSNQGEVSVAVSNINNNTSEYEITVIGNNRYSSFESIDQEHFHNVKLKYFYPYMTDYSSPAVTSFVSKFRNYFYADPNQYSMQGYDITFFFLTAFWEHGKSFFNCLPYMDVGLTQGDYHFEKVSQFGGYMNQGVFLISYKKDYTVDREKSSGNIRYVYK